MLLRNTYTTSFARPGRRVAPQHLHDELRSSRPPRCFATLTRRASLVQAAALLRNAYTTSFRSSRPPRCFATLTRRASARPGRRVAVATLTRRASLVQAAALLRNAYTTSFARPGRRVASQHLHDVALLRSAYTTSFARPAVPASVRVVGVVRGPSFLSVPIGRLAFPSLRLYDEAASLVRWSFVRYNVCHIPLAGRVK